MIIRQFFDEFTAHSSYLIGSGSGKRSSLGCSILKMNGYTNALNLAGGFNAYLRFTGKL